MCGIFAIFSSSLDAPELRKELIKCSSELRHRGPDWSGYVVVDKDVGAGIPLNHGIAHERLAIMDPESGSQPLVSPDGNVIVAANGEVYNYKELYAGLSTPYTPMTGSDCECMLPLYAEHGASPEVPNKLRGMFSVIMYDKATDTFFIFRDHIGKTPLYIGWGNDGSVYVGSEMKSMVGQCAKFQNFPPGFCYTNKGPNAGEFVRWYKPSWAPEMKPGLPPPKEKFQAVSVEYCWICVYLDESRICLLEKFLVGHLSWDFVPLIRSFELTESHTILCFGHGNHHLVNEYYTAIWNIQDVLRHSFEKAVTRRMMSDVPWGVLLSGGLDSSLVASICARNVARCSSSFPKLHSFTVGLEGSPDLKAAKVVADFLGTIHHAYTYTLEEGADAIRDVIRSVETYDVTTIRASTPMYLMSRKIKAMGIKMVLSGEGADEVFGGYLYFHKAPNEQEFFDETVDKISRLHMYDCLRANKAMSAWGVEPRCPFLDEDFLQVSMDMDPKEKMIVKGPEISKEDTRIEKYVIRKAFDTPDDPYLPDEILWRQKEQFSDGKIYCALVEFCRFCL